jgi:ribosomal protein S16
MADVIEFSKYQKPQGATVAQPHAVVTDILTDAEFNELLGVFSPMTAPKTIDALCNEAMEQAYIEMSGGPVDLSSLPPMPAAVGQHGPITADQIKDLRLMVERTRDNLAEYLASYKSHR